MKEHKDIYTVFLNYIIVFTGALCFYYVDLSCSLGSLALILKKSLGYVFFFFLLLFLESKEEKFWWAKMWFPAIMNNKEKNGEVGKIKQANA